MKPSTAQVGLPGIEPRSLAPYAVMAMFVCLLAGGMYIAFPHYDDTLLRIIEVEQTSEDLYRSHGDQPLSGYLWWMLSERGILWASGILLNAVGWFVLASFTYRLYGWMTPGATFGALAASLLAIAPILTEIQFVILSTGTLIVGSTACVYFATSLLLFSGRLPEWLAVVAAGGLAFVGNISYFYGVPAVAAGSAILMVRGIVWSSERPWYYDWSRAAVLILAGGAGFAAYYLTADFSWRTGSEGVARVDAWAALDSASYVLPRIPSKLLGGLWQASGAALLRETGSLVWAGKPALLGIAAGGMMAFLALAVLRPRQNVERAGVANQPQLAAVVVYCVPAMLMAMLPIILMGRTITDETMVSRYMMALTPFGACTTVAIVSRLARPNYVVPVLMAVIAIVTARTVMEALEEQRRCATLRKWGAELRPLLASEGYTLAVLAPGGAGVTIIPDDVLNARLTEGWPVDERRRFWASLNIADRGPAGTTALRNVKRPDKVARMLFVHFDHDRLISVAELKPDQIIPVSQPVE